ncbi:MAG: TonB-dependent receptor [Bacteroidales bacterium]|nr:TonB-dependent receptor [Bacteroidales bacterium]
MAEDLVVVVVVRVVEIIFITGGQSGITNTKSFGLNYSDNWGKKITANGSYFYNSTDNRLIQESNTENLFATNGKFSKTNTDSRTRNYNHRFNMRIEYNIDSANTLLFIPRISTQTNSANKSTLYEITGGDVNSTTNNLSFTDATSYNLSNDLIFRHKFAKQRRTLSLNLSTQKNVRNSENTQLAVVDSEQDNQYSESNTDGFTYSVNASYTEPITKYGMLMVNLTTSNAQNETDKETYRLGDQNVRLNRLDSLSNIYNNDYISNRGGLSYNIRKGDLNFNMGIEYQRATLNGNQEFPQPGKVNKTFENFLPNMMLRYKMSAKSNLRVFFRSSTNAPSISQLQKVIDNSNRLSLSTGNPKLKQEYSQNLMSQFSFANADKGINSFLFCREVIPKIILVTKLSMQRKIHLYPITM